MENEEIKRPKRKIFRKIFLGIVVLIVLLVGYYFVSDFITNYKTNKLKNKIEDIEKDITYAVVEINPKIILEIVNGKVSNRGCLNDDCKVVFNNINVTDKSLKEVVEILYNKAKENDIDVSNGVQVSSSDNKVKEEVEDLTYVKVEIITSEEEEKFISEVIDNDKIKNKVSKEELADKLLKVYKKDKDYNKLYTCNIINNELKCYITEEFEKVLTYEGETLSEIYEDFRNYQKLEKLFDKFNIKYDKGKVEGIDLRLINNVYVNNTLYYLFTGTTYTSTTVSATGPIAEPITSSYNKAGVVLKRNEDFEPFRYEILPFSKFDLVSKSYNEEDVVILTIDENTHKLTTNK